MANAKKTIIGYLVGLFLLFGLFFYIGIGKVVGALSQFQVIYLLPVIVLFLSVLCLSALNLKIMYSPLANIPYFVLLKKYIVSWSLGTVLPSRAGEFSLAYFLREKIPIGKSTAILVLDKLVSLAVFSFFSVLGMFYFFGFKEAFQLFLVLAVLGLLIIFFILSEKTRNLLKKTIFSRIKQHFTGFSKTVNKYLKNEKKTIFANFSFTLLRLFLQAALFFFVFLGFGETVNLLLLICVISVVTILGLLPVAPNGLGVRQVSLVFFMDLLGISAAKTASVSIVLFIINYGFVLTVIGTKMLNERNKRL